VDPVALIVTALAAAAAPADGAPDAVGDAYARLRGAVQRRLEGHPAGQLALARYETDPGAGHAQLAAELELAGAGNDAGLAAAAAAVLGLADSVTGGPGKYVLAVSGSRGVQQGDGSAQFNYFIEKYIDKRGDAEAARSPGGGPAGRLLADVTDPLAVEVHRPVEVDDPPSGLPVLPVYARREHDEQLAAVVRAAAGGASGLAVLVGGSSTGKTRACWEALKQLRRQPEPWRLWHPLDPSRPDAARRELPSVGPWTVVWLNEAQFYLDAPDGAGERVAAGLRELLRDAGRAPVLVLATLWPQFWSTLTARPESSDDPHAQARDLLAGRDIPVPTAFTPAQLEDAAAAAADPRLAWAAEAAEGGQVIQFLAGAPELMARFRNAPPAAAALINAAVDARRLGMGLALPAAFLEAAAPGYLTDTEWDGLGDDWLEQALAYTTAPAKGIRGPLARIRPRPARNDAPAPGTVYRLADYLEQHGRRARRARMPPDDFWQAAARHASSGDLPALASAAEARGLLRDAACIRKYATAQGDVRQAVALVRNWYSLHPHPADRRPAGWAAAHADLDDPIAVAGLLNALRNAGAEEQAGTLAARDPGAHAGLDDLRAVSALWAALRDAGALEQADALAVRAAEHVDLHDPGAVAKLLAEFRRVGAGEQADALAVRAAEQADLHDPEAVTALLYEFRARAREQTNALVARNPREQTNALVARNPAAQVGLSRPDAVAELLNVLRYEEAWEQVDALAVRAAEHADLHDTAAAGRLFAAFLAARVFEHMLPLVMRAAQQADLSDPKAIALLLNTLRSGGAHQKADALAVRVAQQADLSDPEAVGPLLDVLREAGAGEQADALAVRVAQQADLADPGGVVRLLDVLREAGAGGQADALAVRAVEHADLHDPAAVAVLLHALEDAPELVDTLVARDPAARADLRDPGAVAVLLGALRDAEGMEQADALAARAAARADLHDPAAVATLLLTLWKSGAEDHANALLARDPAAHAALGDADAVARLLSALLYALEITQTEEPAAHPDLRDPAAAIRLVDAPQMARFREQADGLAARAAAHVDVSDAGAVARLLNLMRQAGGQEEQAGALAARAAAHVDVEARRPSDVIDLLDSMREAGAEDQAGTLAGRLPAEGRYIIFRRWVGDNAKYRFGRDLDGSPALPWQWDHLDRPSAR
jgi:uncharacterized protein YidB (DUF937 family)